MQKTEPKYYRPREIAKLGLIKNSTGGDNVESNYNFILVQIKNGRLKATDYSESKKVNYWLVSEDSIREYHKTIREGTNHEQSNSL